MIRLVVNADDLGLAPEIDAGIFDAAARGIVTSASLLVGGRTFDAVRAGLAERGIGVGIHLAAVGGLVPVAPLSRIPVLAEEGLLPASWIGLVRKLVAKPSLTVEVLAEFEAQLSRARDCKIEIDHLDAHQHLHVWPSLLPGVLDLCRRFAIRAIRIPDERLNWRSLQRPLRVAMTAPLTLLASRARTRLGSLVAPRFWGLFAGGQLDRPALLRVLAALPDGDHEIGCHPGLGVAGVPEDPQWRYRWDAELVALRDAQARAIIEKRGIQLCRYSDLVS